MKTHVHKKMTKEMLRLLPREVKSFFNREINGQKIINIIAVGSYTEDTTCGPLAEVGDCVAPWLEHFWQQNLGTKGLHYPKTNIIAPSCVSLKNNRASYLRATDYWDNYILGNHRSWKSKSAIEKEEALHFLGRVIHLLQDMSTPAHTNNDMHVTIGGDGGDWIDWWDDDDYEDYVGKECKPSIPYKYRVSHNLKTFNESNWSIHQFFHNLAKETRKYDSDDVDGKGSGLPYRYPYWTIEKDEDGHHCFRDGFGDLTDWACNAIAKNMMPLSYSYASSILIKFLTDLDISSEGNSLLGEKAKLNIQLDKFTVYNDQDNHGSGEMIFKVINGANYSHIDKDDIPVLNNINSGQTVFCNYAIGKREIRVGEAIKIYIEMHDDDDTINDFVGRATFDIRYDDIKNYINKNKSLHLSSGDSGMRVTLSIRATAEESDNENREKQEALEFYRVNIKSLDKESGSWYLHLGRDDVVVQNFSRTTTHAILSSHETIRLIEEDVFGTDDEVNDFKWERWKEWINQRNHIEPVHIKGSSGRHRIQLNIEKYTKPSRPSHIESNRFEVDGYLHSIETPIGDNKYKIDIRKKHAIQGVFVSKESDIVVNIYLGGTSRRVFISNSEWTRWIKEGKGLYTKQIHGVKYNFIIFLKPIKSTYSVTSYLDKIYVVYDNDDAWGDWGEIYAKYYVDGKMKKKYDLGTLDGGGHAYSKNKLLGKNEIFKEGESISFDIKVWDYDAYSSDDSLGTVKVNIPYSEWSNWRDRDNHITGYIKSSNGDCRLTFRFKIKETFLSTKSLSTTKKVTNFSTNIIQPISTINSELVIIPPYMPFPPYIFETSFSKTLKKLPKHNDVKAKLEKPLVNEETLKMDTENIYYYDNNTRRLVLHKKGCHYLSKIKNPKALYLMKNDIYKIKSIKNITLLHPYYALKKLEDELNLLPKKISREYVGLLIDKKLIHSKTNNEIIRKMFIKLLNNPITKSNNVELSNSTEYHQIIAQLAPSNTHLSLIEKKLVYGNLKITLLNNKVERLKKINSTLSRRVQTDIYKFKRKIHDAKFCSCCD